MIQGRAKNLIYDYRGLKIRSFKKSNKLRKLTKEYLKYSITEHNSEVDNICY